jgi:hypothetical protein
LLPNLSSQAVVFEGLELVLHSRAVCQMIFRGFLQKVALGGGDVDESHGRKLTCDSCQFA